MAMWPTSRRCINSNAEEGIAANITAPRSWSSFTTRSYTVHLGLWSMMPVAQKGSQSMRKPELISWRCSRTGQGMVKRANPTTISSRVGSTMPDTTSSYTHPQRYGRCNGQPDRQAKELSNKVHRRTDTRDVPKHCLREVFRNSSAADERNQTRRPRRHPQTPPGQQQTQ